uniref:Uncharacterized protein n=1 Tax=Aegilops tauschii subsp. strangulata TaxID=200361 RepID=A0A453SSY7_AEGTS
EFLSHVTFISFAKKVGVFLFTLCSYYQGGLDFNLRKKNVLHTTPSVPNYKMF